MDPAIWSRLPQDILIEVIKHATAHDDEGNNAAKERLRQKWLETVRGNTLLNTIVLRQRYGWAKMFWYDCFWDDNELPPKSAGALNTHRKRTLYDYLKPNATAGIVVHLLLPKEHGLRPAEVLHALYLYMLMEDRDVKELMPIAHRMVKSTVKMLLPVTRSLQKLITTGPTSDVILEAIRDSNLSQLHTLEVGSNDVNYRYHSHPDDPNFDIHDWCKLSKVTSLTNLTINAFVEEEARSLINLLSNLINLKELRLMVKAPSAYQTLTDQQSPLQALFDSYLVTDDHKTRPETNLLTVLPINLRKLFLVDPYYIGHQRLHIPQPKENTVQLSSCHLQEVSLVLDDLQSVSNLLQWFPQTALDRLSLAPVDPTSLDITSGADTALEIVNTIVSANVVSLEHVVFTNAWKMDENFADTFNQHNAGTFRITDVLLLTACPQTTGCQGLHEMKPQPQANFEHIFYGCSMNRNRWGTEIKRIRIDMKYTYLITNRSTQVLLDHPNLKNLRVFIIGLRYNDLADRSRRQQYHEVATNISKRAPANLRVIMICNWVFWVTTNDGLREVHPFDPDLKTAEQDATTQSFNNWKTPEDVEFMNAHSWINNTKISDDEVAHPPNKNPYWPQMFNFLVARRTN